MTALHRFRPTRAGIVNLYEYGDQVFSFSGGRLLLRGHNTSGKTKALELLLPFVLDGNTSPQRLDPFAQSAKEMKWNLVGCTDADQRIGYVWVEFERVDEAGAVQRVTAGIGLKAHRDRTDVIRWHFVATGRRIGDDLALLHDSREPISKRDLIAALGDDGEVLDRQSDYRARLRETLLDITTEQQHQTMLRLMRELRRPHLSKTLEPDGVAGMLTAGLPEVDEHLMRRLAGGLEQLEALEAKLERQRAVRERVRRFHDRTYRAYLRAVLRERASALRGADSEVGRAAEAARARTTERESAEAEQERLQTAVREAQAAVERWEGEERALVGSTAWRAVAEIEALRERAEAQARTADTVEERYADEAGRTATHEAELVLGEEELAVERDTARDDLERFSAEAQRAGLQEHTRPLDVQLTDASLSAQSWRELTAELAAGRAAVLTEHQRLLAAAGTATEQLDRAREVEEEAGARSTDARRAGDEAERALEDRRAEASVALEQWSAALSELDPDAAALSDARELAMDGRAAHPALDAAVGAARGAVAAARAQIDVEATGLWEERRDLEHRCEDLEAQRDVPPVTPPWRDGDRDRRPGAPLWALVDFADDVPADDRAGLEAALEASGLLDAWVTPDGSALPGGVLDAALVADGRPGAGGPSLATVLVSAADGPVAADVVDRLLRAVSLEEGGVRIGRDGTFRLGPLAGAAQRDRAEHVGASARAAHRVRLLAELRAAVETIDGKLAALDEQRAALDARERRVKSELEALPAVDDVADALRSDALAVHRVTEAVAAHERARTRVAHAQDAELAARADVREHAVEHRLGAGLDAAGVAARRDACLRLESGAGGVAQRFVLVAALAERLTSARDRLEELRTRVDRLRVGAERERAQARRLAAEHAARDAALGAGEREVRERHEHAQTELRTARELAKAHGEAERATVIALNDARRDEHTSERALESARDRRATAHHGLIRLGAEGLLPLALGDDAPADHGEARSWPMTRALEVARAVPEAVMSTSTEPGKQAQSVMQGVSGLDRELAQSDMGAVATPASDGLLLVEITDGATPRPFADALADLEAEIAERERVLTAEERRVFGDAIFEELAEHLRLRILDVHGRVSEMNAVLRRAPTAAGKTVVLQWQPSDEEGLRDAIAMLRRSHLDEQQRAGVIEFFRERVQAARRASAAEAPEPMAQTLTTAFDYRSWHRFDLLLEIDGNRKRLTKRRHAIGSGGEQSTLIHLPLFAAAAALYGDGRGPRLVMLDEALSGIDDDTRERVLAATVAFDLDLVMTSHELWGTYVTVPSLAIYQLHRENGVYGVQAIPFVWDGAELREDEQGELFVG